jgi:uncharacterized protein (DUF302 family)
MESTGPATPTGIITKDSPRIVDETVARLIGLIDARAMKLFAVIDQAAAAHEAGLDLRPTTFVTFGNPTAGTAVMEAVPLSAL